MAQEASESKGTASAGAPEKWSKTTDAHVTDFKKDKSPRGPVVGAWVLWVVGFLLEAAAVLVATGSFGEHVDLAVWQRVIIALVALVADAACVLVGLRLWRKVTAARSKAKGKKQAGPSIVSVIMACVAFVPMVLFFATSKNAGTRTLLAAIIAALVSAAALGALAVTF